MLKTGRFHIYIHYEGEDGESPVAGESGGSSKSYGAKTERSLEKGLKGLVSFGAVKSTAQNLVNLQTRTIELRTGASEFEQKLQLINDSIFQGIGAGGLIFAGAKTGNLPAVLIGLGASLVDKLFSIYARQREINIKQNLEDVSIRMSNIRAGVGGRRGREQ